MIKGTGYVFVVFGIPMALVLGDKTALQFRIASVA